MHDNKMHKKIKRVHHSLSNRLLTASTWDRNILTNKEVTVSRGPRSPAPLIDQTVLLQNKHKVLNAVWKQTTPATLEKAILKILPFANIPAGWGYLSLTC